MRLASARLVAQIQQKVEDHTYGDTATIEQKTRTSSDGFGQPVNTTTSTVIECSFTDIRTLQGGRALEIWKDFVDISQIAAEIRYSGNPVPAKGNTVLLTGRFDSADYVDTRFEVIGIQERDVFGHLLALMQVS